MRVDFSIHFAPEITREKAEKVVAALEKYYKACGGQGFEVQFEETSDPLPRVDHPDEKQ